MPRRRNLRLYKYNINDDQYQELFYFCKQYRSRQIEINSMYELAAVNQDGMPKGNMVGSQVESKAIRILKLQEENKMIEEAAEEADKCIAKHILKNVTEGIAYDYLNVPCGKRQFYEKRRLFYKILSEKR